MTQEFLKSSENVVRIRTLGKILILTTFSDDSKSSYVTTRPVSFEFTFLERLSKFFVSGGKSFWLNHVRAFCTETFCFLEIPKRFKKQAGI